MASEAVTILAAVVTAIQAANGAGVYTYDLSASTYYGPPKHAGRPSPTAEAWVRVAETEATRGDPLRWWTHIMRVEVIGIVHRLGNTEQAKQEACLNLANDLHRAIMDDVHFGLPSVVLDTIPPRSRIIDGARLDSVAAPDGTPAFALPGIPVVVMDVVISYRMLTGS